MMDAAQSPAGAPASHAMMTLDTTAGSVIHRLATFLCPAGFDGVLSTLKLYVAAVAVTFFPLFVGAVLSPIPLFTPTPQHPLPFLGDWNVLFMLLVSFPCLSFLLVTGQPVLVHSLQSVQADGTITISQADQNRLMAHWQEVFRRTNLWGQATGTVIGALIAYFNLVAYTPEHVGFWIADNGRLLPVGFVFLYCVFLFYALMTLYVFRNFAISFLLRDIVAHAELHMLPFHPDRAGGLRPVGRLGLRNQYGLTLLGLNVVLLVMISRLHLEITESLTGLIVAAIVAYLLLGPLVFMAPLLPFRSGMLKNKSQLMREVALRIRMELDRLRKQLASGPITEDDEEMIERLRKIGGVINELPVWPFDATTLRKFLTAYAIPIASTAGYPIVKAILSLINGHLPNLTFTSTFVSRSVGL